MKYIHLFLVLAVFFSVDIFAAAADDKAKFVADDAISIDADAGDWSGVKNFFDDFGGQRSDANVVDIKAMKMAYSKNSLFFHMSLNKEIGSWKPNGDVSIFQIYFDVDGNENSGSSKITVYGTLLKSTGYEYRLEVKAFKDGKVEAELYSKSNNFNKKEKSWKADSAEFKAKGKAIEFKLSLDELSIDNEGLSKVRFLFAEYATSQKAQRHKGLKAMGYSFDFKKTAPAATSEESGSAASSSGSSSIWMLMVATIWIVSILCALAIVPKAGLSTGVALINLIPFAGQLIFLFILAFNKWPLHDDYHSLEERIAELEAVEPDEY